MATGLFESVFADEETEELEEFEDSSVQDGLPRYGHRYEPAYADSLADDADVSRRMPELLSTPLDPVEPEQTYGPSREVSDLTAKSGLSSFLFDSPDAPKADPDEPSFGIEDIDPAVANAMQLGPNLDELKYVRNTANFLFGEDLAIMGIKWDEYGLDVSIENMVNQWADHPVMSTVSLLGLAATAVFPAVGVIRKSAKIGKLAQRGITQHISEAEKFRRIGEKVTKATKFDPVSGKFATKYPLLGFKPTTGLKESSLLKHGDDWQATMKDLLEVQDDAGQGLKHFNLEDAAKYREMLDTGRGDEAINLFGKENIKKALLDQDARNRFDMLRWKVENDFASPFEHMKYDLQKHFNNTYFMIGSAMTPRALSKITEFMENSQLWKPFAFEVPKEHHKAWTMAMSGVIDQNDRTFQAIRNNPELYRVWQAQRTAYQRHHTKAIESGFLTEGEVARASLPDPSLHIKAETGAGRVGWSSGAVFKMASREGSEEFEKARTLGGIWKAKVKAEPTLTSPALSNKRIKYRDPDVLKAAYESGELISDPGQVSQFSLMHDMLVFNTYDQIAEQAVMAMKIPRGVVDKKGWFKSAETVAEFGPKTRARYIDLNNLDEELEAMGHGANSGMAERVRRMIAVKLGASLDAEGRIVSGTVGELPWMNKKFFDDIFHPEHGVFGATEHMVDAMTFLGAMHKTTATTLNIRTHGTNLAGNFMMLVMAGKNPFSRQAISDGKNAVDVFRQLSRRKINDNVDPELLFSPDELVGAFERSGVERYLTTKAGSQVDLAEVLANPIVHQLIEKNAFQNAEGLGRVKAMLNVIDKARGDVPLFTKMSAKLASTLTGVSVKPGPKRKLTKSFEWMADAYMMEDMVPKMMYLTDLLRSGMSVDSAVMEVGRRLPQYATVGRSIKGARRRFVPWITFPAEMTRIMKNNIQDFPLRTAALLRTPSAMQAIFQDSLGPATEAERTDAMREAPLWAQKGTSVLMESGRTTGALLAGSTGAFAGAVVGGASAGVIGAMVGATAGGVGGAAAGYAFGEEDEKNMRAWTMDFLPWSALQPKSMSPEMEPVDLKGIIDLSPVEPYAVLMPLVNVYMGQDDFGREIPVTGKLDAMSKAAMAFSGFLAPPLMQKYGMRVGYPDSGMFDLGEVGTRLGATGVGAGLGMAGGGVKGAVAGGAIGLIAGANTSRLQEDLGINRNMYTGQPGNPIYDVLLNSVLGIGVSYKATPEQRFFNERKRREHYGELRKIWQKQVDYAIANGDDDMLHEHMAKIGRSFTSEYLNPQLATEKFGEYVKRRLPKLGRHPQLRGYSEEKLGLMLDEAIRWASVKRTEALERRIRAIQEEMFYRELARESEGMNVGGYDYDINTASGLLQYMTPTRRKSKGTKIEGTLSGGTAVSGTKVKGFF